MPMNISDLNRAYFSECEISSTLMLGEGQSTFYGRVSSVQWVMMRYVPDRKLLAPELGFTRKPHKSLWHVSARWKYPFDPQFECLTSSLGSGLAFVVATRGRVLRHDHAVFDAGSVQPGYTYTTPRAASEYCTKARPLALFVLYVQSSYSPQAFKAMRLPQPLPHP